MAIKGFTGTQKQYLEGLASGLRLAQKAPRSSSTDVRSANEAPVLVPSNPDQAAWDAQDRCLAAGQRLSPEENAKRRHAPEQVWARITRRASERGFPEGDDVFLYLDRRHQGETFRQFVGRVPPPDLQRWTRERQVNGAGGLR